MVDAPSVCNFVSLCDDLGFIPRPLGALTIAGMEALRLHRLSWRPGSNGRVAVEEIDLAVQTTEVLGLLGPSGAGKTSLLRLMAGLQLPDQGRIEICGTDVTLRAASERPVGMVAQDARLFPDLSVVDNVAFRLRLQPDTSALAKARALDTLRLLGIAALAGRRADDLSEGEKQRVALARALVSEPALLLLDEPMSHLDRPLRRALRAEILALKARLGLTLVYVTHDQSEAMAISDRIALLRGGRLIQQGTPRLLYEQPASDFVAGFMGDMRLFDGWCDGQGMISLGPLRVPLKRSTAPASGPVRVVVRPQAWRIGPAHLPGLPGRVLGGACTGAHIEYRVGSSLGEVLVTTPRAHRRHECGAPVSLTLSEQGLALLPAQTSPATAQATS